MGPEKEEVEDSKYSSRKFILTAASLVVSAFALFTGFLKGDEFVDIIAMILAIYGTSNVAGYFAAKGK